MHVLSCNLCGLYSLREERHSEAPAVCSSSTGETGPSDPRDVSAGESVEETLAPGPRQTEQTRGTPAEAERGDQDCTVALIKEYVCF